MDTLTQQLAEALLREKKYKRKNGIYYYTQIYIAYNSNRIEGSRLSEEHTRTLFETHTLLPNGKEVIYSDDVIEANNHFRAFDYMLMAYKEPLTEDFMKKLQALIVENTAESHEDYFNVGEYKKLGNVIGFKETVEPEDVPAAMLQLINGYSKKSNITLDDILAFHVRFESIHPFQNGNGRVGRLLMYKECLRTGIFPFVITDDLKPFYIRGLNEYGHEKGYLTDTCLLAQDRYKLICKRLVQGE